MYWYQFVFVSMCCWSITKVIVEIQNQNMFLKIEILCSSKFDNVNNLSSCFKLKFSQMNVIISTNFEFCFCKSWSNFYFKNLKTNFAMLCDVLFVLWKAKSVCNCSASINDAKKITRMTDNISYQNLIVHEIIYYHKENNNILDFI